MPIVSAHPRVSENSGVPVSTASIAATTSSASGDIACSAGARRWIRWK